MEVIIAGHGNGTSILNNAKRRHMEVPSNNQIVKRMRTPSPVRELVDERIEELLLFRNRMKRAISDPEEFLPNGIFKAFPSIGQDYEILINHSPFTTDMTMNETNIDAAINKLAGPLLHAMIADNNNDWFFIAQVELYLKNKAIDDVAVTSKYDRFNDKLATSVEKLQEGKGT